LESAWLQKATKSYLLMRISIRIIIPMVKILAEVIFVMRLFIV